MAYHKNFKITFLVACVVVLLFVAGTAAVMYPAIRAAREAARKSSCTGHLKQFGVAFHYYHEKFGCFPPAFVADQTGNPMHSWRVLILPFLGDQRLERAYAQYHFNEPWNGPNNRQVADVIDSARINPFACPSSISHRETNYVAVVGPETVWPGPKATASDEVTDGTSNTILIVEIADSGMRWMEPRDLTFEQASQDINSSSIKFSLSSNHAGGANTLFCDGSVRFLKDDIPSNLLRKLLTATGGETVMFPE
jgi:prepilin-type processing-associated H-X9-DG protein